MDSCGHRSHGGSGEVARVRAKLTVASDRLGCGQGELQQMQKELMAVLAKYMNLGGDGLEIRMDIVRRIKQGVQDVKTIQIK